MLQERNYGVGESAISFGLSRTRVRSKLHRTGKFLLGFQQVGGNVNDHRAGTSAACPMKAFGNGFGNFVDGANQAAPLGQRESDAENICLLKRIGSDERAPDLPGDADQGNGIHLGISNAGDEIGRAGTAGGHSHADFPGNTRIAFGGEHGALLVAREDVAHAAAFEGVVQRHDRAAGVAKDQVYAFRPQALQDYVGSFNHSAP